MTVATMVAALALATATSAQGQMRQAGSRHGEGVGVTVAAPLAALDDGAGWGRVTVTDLTRSEVLERAVNVCLHGLAPEAEFDVAVDGIGLGTVTTDADGEAWLALRSDSHLLPPVPVELPPADMLVTASVTDASLAVVLEGDFVPIAHGTPGLGALVYQERIRLENQLDRWQCGTARVARDSEDEQTFDTRATGLAAGAAHSVRVDGVAAGVVTPDASGQAQLVLSTEDGSLPESLQPIEDLRVVEWLLEGDVVLSGAFTGDGTVGGQGPADDPPGGGGDDGGLGGPGDGDGHHGEPGDGGQGGNGGDDGGNGGDDGGNGGGDGSCDGGDGGGGGGGRP